MRGLGFGLVMAAGAWAAWSGQAAGAAAPEPTLTAGFRAAWELSEDRALRQEAQAQAEARRDQAFGAIWPSFGASATAFWESDDEPGSGARATASATTARLYAGQTLFQGFREFAVLRQASDYLTLQHEYRRAALLDLYARVAEAFFQTAAQAKDLEHLRAAGQLYDERIRDLQARARIGRSRPAEVLAAQTAAAQLRAEAEDAAGLLAQARETLADLTGWPPETAVQADSDSTAALAPLAEYLGRLDERPDVRAGGLQSRLAREDLAVAQAGHWPVLSLGASYYLVENGRFEPGDWDATAGVDLPLFAGGAVGAKVREAESRLRESEWLAARVRRNAAHELKSLYLACQADLARGAAQAEALRLAEQNYRATLRDYNLSLVTNLDVLQALSAFQDGERALDATRYRLLIRRCRLEAAAGRRPALAGEESRP